MGKRSPRPPRHISTLPDPKVVNILVKAGAYVNAQDKEGRTILMEAATHNSASNYAKIKDSTDSSWSEELKANRLFLCGQVSSL